ncbi:MAG: very short patch repair endonuclease [Gemmatimonadota bacterium]|nr:very short patch repair endonuclease [Gemmatimonadota bacterium]
MPDAVTREVRSRIMSGIRSKDTRIELEVRRRLFALGYRYRMHRKDLPGTPDIVFPKFRAAIFVHGCFWHYHGCHLSVVPQTRRSWWLTKLSRTANRDFDAVSELRKQSWRVLVIWECAFRKPRINRCAALDSIAIRAADFLNSTSELVEIPCPFDKSRFDSLFSLGS